MGVWMTRIWWGGDPDTVNPMSGLTRREIHLVQKSWAPVAANPIASGTELLKRLFAANPDIRDFFKMVRKLPEAEYSQNPQFKAHVLNLMTSVTLAVNNLNQPEIVAAMLTKIGESHGKRGIKERHFNDLKGVIVKMFIEVLQMDTTTLAAWSKTVDFWYKHIFPGLNATENR